MKHNNQRFEVDEREEEEVYTLIASEGMFWQPDVFHACQHNLKEILVQEIKILLDSNKARIKPRGDSLQNIYSIKKNREFILAP